MIRPTMYICLLLISTSFVINTNAQTFNNTVNPQGSTTIGYCGYGLSINIISGRPAMAFAGEASAPSVSGSEYPTFIIADDSNGTSWSSKHVIQSVDLGAIGVGLVDANGRPGVFYIEANTPDVLYFERSDNDTGSSWTGTSHAIHTGANSMSELWPLTVKGKPAAMFLSNGSPDTLFFIRALDSNGSSWSSAVTITTPSASTLGPRISIINDKPAVTFYEGLGDTLVYIIASNDTGSAWDAAISVAAGRVNNNSYPSLAAVGGRPAIAYMRNTTSDTLFFMRANDADGSSWPTSPTVVYHPGTSAGSHIQLGVMADTPVVFFEFSGDADNSFVKASDTIGSAWGGITAFSSGNDGDELVMVIDSRNDVHLAFYEIGGDSIGYIYGDGPAPSVTSTNWNGSTWSNNAPTSTVNAIIESNTAPTTFTCKDLTINSGFALNTGTSDIATIHGDIINNGNGVTGTGTLTFTKSGTASISGDTLEHEGTVVVESGCTLTTNSLLRLTSDAGNTGRIGESDGTISGNVYVQRYMPGKRCFRFYGHPFSTSIALSQLTDAIDITGSGGSSNGFTTTSTNNPSAFWFDVSSADTSTAGNNPGWTAFTSANSADWDQYELLRLLVRGAKGEGLTGGAYSPSAATFEGVGSVNQGTQVVTLTKGSGSEFVGCGNPFPSPVQMNALAKGSNVGANYYAWDATSGASGAYVTNAFTLDYKLPAFAAFFTTVSANSNNTLTFEEQDKEATGAGLFKTSGANDWIELYVYDSTTKWDRLLINLNSNGMPVEDKLDGKKLYNPNLDFFTLSQDSVRLAVDVRPYDDGHSIPLGLTAYNRYNKYVMRAGMFDIPAGTKLILHDKYLNMKEEIKTGFEYWFDVTADSNSQGNNRFEINMVGKPANVIEAKNCKPQIQLIPNPAKDEVKLSFNSVKGTADLSITNNTGQVIFKQDIQSATGSVVIPLKNMPSGIYIVVLRGKNIQYAEKLIIE